jgi:AraC-like DNA-binding protein
VPQPQTRWSAYFGRSPALDGLGLRCIGVGAQDGRLAPVKDRVLDHHGLVIIDRGSGMLTSAGRSFPVAPGTLFWLFPGVRHSYGPDDRGWSERWVLFEGSATQAYRRLGLLDPEQPSMQPNRLQELLGWFSQLRTSAGARSVVSGAAMSVVVQEMILNSAGAARRSAAVDDQQLLAAVRDLAGSSRTIPDIATEIGSSEGELRRVIKTMTGMTPKAYLLAVRMETAQSLLTDTADPISQIGRRCGYDDPSYFTRVFTRFTGTSPTRFRDQYGR